MKRLTLLASLMLLMAACAPGATGTPSAALPSPVLPTSAPPAAEAAPAQKTVQAQQTVGAQQTVQAQQTAPGPIVSVTPSPAGPPAGAGPVSAVVTPAPAQAATATPLSRTGWKTYVDNALKVSLQYPPDWRATQETGGSTFTSPQGLAIQLARIETGNVAPDQFENENLIPNARCVSSTNEHGVAVRICTETTSFTTTASLILKSPSSPARLISLTMRSKASDAAVFQAMVATVRPLP